MLVQGHGCNANVSNTLDFTYVFYMQAVEAQFSVDDVCITTLRKFRFPSTSTDEAISIKFDREVTGGWHLALETSDEVFTEYQCY